MTLVVAILSRIVGASQPLSVAFRPTEHVEMEITLIARSAK